jgi:hypothetical protein
MSQNSQTNRLHLASALCALAISLACGTARAELRVFELEITSSTNGVSRTVITNLDHLQYASYYPLNKDETVILKDSWMCRQRSDRSQDPFQRYCPNPRNPASVTNSSVATPKTGPSPNSATP